MGLMDIAPPEIITRRFEIRGGSIEVRGIKTREWVSLQRRFPQLRIGMNGQESGEDIVLVGIEGLVPAIIAAGLGAVGDEETESLIMERLSDSDQSMIFGAIMELTAPQVEEKKAGPLANPTIESRPPTVEQLPNGSAEPPMMNSQQLSLL